MCKHDLNSIEIIKSFHSMIVNCSSILSASSLRDVYSIWKSSPVASWTLAPLEHTIFQNEDRRPHFRGKIHAAQDWRMGIFENLLFHLCILHRLTFIWFSPQMILAKESISNCVPEKIFGGLPTHCSTRDPRHIRFWNKYISKFFIWSAFVEDIYYGNRMARCTK